MPKPKRETDDDACAGDAGTDHDPDAPNPGGRCHASGSDLVGATLDDAPARRWLPGPLVEADCAADGGLHLRPLHRRLTVDLDT
jgi:hypothetical protein